MKGKSIAYVSFPKTGLGNLLLIWSRACVFSHLNKIPLVTSGWWGIRWGTWLRNEQRKRLYWGYFRESSSLEFTAAQLLRWCFPVIQEPPIELQTGYGRRVVYFFSKIAVDNDLFGAIRPYRSFINAEIIRLLKPTLIKQLHMLEKPEIAIHIRRGDFAFGNPLTPNAFFVRCIGFIREQTKKDLCVTVFTDGKLEEIEEILQLQNIHIAKKKPDILDILQMSKSRILILSQSSTFSYWAAFLSDAIVIKPDGDWQGDLRPVEINQVRFEGKINFDESETLERLSRALQKEQW
jgi:hypothetical protein